MLGWRSRWCGWQVLVEMCWFATDDLGCLAGEVGDHVGRDGQLDEVVQRGLVLGDEVW